MSFGGFSPIPRKNLKPGEEQKPLGVVKDPAGPPPQPSPAQENKPLGVIQAPVAPAPQAPAHENRPLGVVTGPAGSPQANPASLPSVQPQPVDPFQKAPPAQVVVQPPTVNPFAHLAQQRPGAVFGPLVDPFVQTAPRAPQIPLPPTGPPDPDAVAVVGRFNAWPWRQFPDEAYLADALEALGKRVVRIDQDHPQVLLPPALWAVCTAYPSSMEKIWRWAGERRTILWTLDWLLHDEYRRPAIEQARAATLFASSDEWDWKASHGIPRHFYLPGACEAVPVPFDPRPVRKCAFMGSIYNERRRTVARIVRSMGGEVLDHPGAWLYGNDLARFVQDTKVVVGDNARNDVQGYWSSRNYIVPGAGGFLLTPRVPGIEEQFTPEAHIALFDSVEELPGKIEWWASHDAERERVRGAGFRHVRENHHWRSRAAVLLAAIEKYSHESR